MDECFDVVGWEFGGHDCVVVFATSFLDIPVDGFEGSSFLPERPEVATGFFAGGHDVVVVAVGVESAGEVAHFFGRPEGEGVLFDLKPGDEEGVEL